MRTIPWLLLLLSFAPVPASAAAPRFSDPTELVAWLFAASGRHENFYGKPSVDNVFSPGLIAALDASFRRSKQRDEPPCGANGDIILDTQENGTAQNLRLSAKPAGPDRVTVAASFDIDGYHRDRLFKTVKLGDDWKLENIVESDGTSLRRSLACLR